MYKSSKLYKNLKLYKWRESGKEISINEKNKMWHEFCSYQIWLPANYLEYIIHEKIVYIYQFLCPSSSATQHVSAQFHESADRGIAQVS